MKKWLVIFSAMFFVFFYPVQEIKADFSLEELMKQQQLDDLIDEVLFPFAIEGEKDRVSSFMLLQPNDIFTNLGSTVSTVYPMKSVSFNDQNGIPHMIVGMQGEPAVIVVINLQTGKIVDQRKLDGAKAVWAIEKGAGQTVWIGTTPNENIYSYNYSFQRLTQHGKATGPQGNTTIWDLTFDHSTNTLYGGNSYSGSVFSFKEGVGFSDLGQMATGKQFVRSVAVHERTQTLFAGIGSKAELISYDLRTGLKQNILPEQYREESYVYDLDIVDDLLFAKLNPTQKIVVFDIYTWEVVGEFPAGSSGISRKAPNENAVYYTFDNAIYRYDLGTKETKRFPANMFSTSAVSLDFVTYNNSQFPGHTLVGLAGNGGRYFKFNLQTERFEMGMLDLPPQPTIIHHISKLPNGEIISSGFISGNYGVYHPATDNKMVYRGHGQIEGAAELGGKMYYGVYPNARIFEFDPKQSWQSLARVPKDLVISDLGSFGQDRPVAMLGIEELNRLFIGTFPQTGRSGGALVSYDPITKERVVRNNIIPNQSIISLAYRQTDGHLYFGTSVYGGRSSVGTGGSAQLFAIPATDPNAEPVRIPLPLNQPKLISALTVTDDGRIWGLGDGNLFVYRSSAERTRIIPIVRNTTGFSGNGSLVVGDDGHIYGTVEKTLFRVHKDTLELTILRNSNDVEMLVKGNNGDLFFTDSLNLWRANFNLLKDYHPEQQEVGVRIPNISFPATHPYPVARLYVTVPSLIYKKVGSDFIPERTINPNETYRIYGIDGQYYNLGGNLYVEHDPINVSVYIGKVMIMEGTPLYDPYGNVVRQLRERELLNVYSYDDEKYNVGDGFYVLKDHRSRYVIGTATPSENVPLYGKNGEVLGLIQRGYPFAVHKVEGNMIFIEGDYYIIADPAIIRYMKN